MPSINASLVRPGLDRWRRDRCGPEGV